MAISATDLRVSSLIREAARRRGLTQTDLADAAGMSRRSMGARITGRTQWSFTEVSALAPVLDIDAEVLLDAASDGDEVLSA